MHLTKYFIYGWPKVASMWDWGAGITMDLKLIFRQKATRCANETNILAGQQCYMMYHKDPCLGHCGFIIFIDTNNRILSKFISLEVI